MIDLLSILFVQDENGNIVHKPIVVVNRDVIFTEEDLKDLVEIEVDEGCHDDYAEDYKNKLEFYLSNCKLENYTNFLNTYFNDSGKNFNQDSLEYIQELVIEEIKSKFN